MRGTAEWQMQRPQRDPHEGDDTRQDRRNQHDRRLAALPQRCHPSRSCGTGPSGRRICNRRRRHRTSVRAGCRAPQIFRLGGEYNRRQGAPVDLDTGRLAESDEWSLARRWRRLLPEGGRIRPRRACQRATPRHDRASTARTGAAVYDMRRGSRTHAGARHMPAHLRGL